MAKGRRLSAIPEDWQPNETESAYAAGKGLDASVLVEPFRDHHTARGTLFADWSAAWRTWCRNEIAYGYPNKSRLKPVVNGADPFGAAEWAAGLTDTVPDMVGGQPVATLAGYDVAGVARDVCEAAGLPHDWRGDLAAIAGWLRAGVDPAHMLRVVQRSNGPRTPGSWRYYDKAMREGRDE